ncbi:UvrB/UvrC motif-containing protein [Spirochaetia bacterium 38H-sp]|uniref:UvrB/UvrC motif-containing protein n=1 Tax=Rarispira pelagica TaxID=3141764 RepID=A0ABU9UDZ3_9SPIR
MACSICGESEVVIRIQQIVDGNIKEIELCAQCAESFEIENFGGEINFSMDEFFQAFLTEEGFDDIFDEEAMSVDDSDIEYEGLYCPTCGMPYEEFSARYRAGCPDCYYAFRSEILKYFQEGYRYKGNVPPRFAGFKTALIDRVRLKHSLEHALMSEDYEKAARIRDRLKQIEEESSGQD